MKKILLTAAAAVLFCLPAAAADFNGDGTGDLAIFRPASGLWAVRGVTRIYFGGTGDIPVPGDYNGNGTDAAAVFRGSSGLWAVRGVTRVYFGGSTDQVKPGDYSGDGTSDFGIFRPGTGLWAVRGVTRVYFGTSSDIAIDPGPPRGRSGGLLKTGQTSSDTNYDDGFYQAGVAFSYYTEAPSIAYPDEVVTVDIVTGLMWASDGFGYGCGWGDEFSWINAISEINDMDFAGYKDWRLPNLRELHSLVNTGRHTPALDPAYFPNTRTAVFTQGYWTSSHRLSNRADAWVIFFQEGRVNNEPKSKTYYFRAVRGGN